MFSIFSSVIDALTSQTPGVGIDVWKVIVIGFTGYMWYLVDRQAWAPKRAFRRHFRFGTPKYNIPNSAEEHIVSMVLNDWQDRVNQAHQLGEELERQSQREKDVWKARQLLNHSRQAYRRERSLDEQFAAVCEVALRFDFKWEVGNTAHAYLIPEAGRIRRVA